MKLLSIKDLSRFNIEKIIQRAISFKNGGKAHYPNHALATVFLEPSTRTLLSFQKAALNLGMQFLNLDVAKSSFKKGETLEDALLNLQAMGINHFVIRSQEEKYWQNFKEEFSLINGGDGSKNHPSQALLDAMTIYEHFNTLENLKVVVIGDIKHSRVYRSNKELLSKFNSEVDFLGSKELGGNDLPINDCLAKYDVVMMLRIQHERHSSSFNTNLYNSKWGLNKHNLKFMKKNAIILHPGPINREVEITSDILYDDKRNKILDQVKNGVYIRMALLEQLCKNI